MLSCIIIEDQPPAQKILQKYVEEVEELTLKETFSDATKARVFLVENEIDLIFLDINLPKISGIEFLKTTPNHPNIILTTTFSEYAVESYQFNVVDYLLKPISFERFLQAIYKLDIANFKNKTVFIKSGYDYIKINITNILYIKSDDDYTEIITNSKNYLSKESLKYWLQRLSNSEFSQIHKSYILNTNQVNKISANQVHLFNNVVLPIGRAYKKSFMEKYIQ